MVITADFPNYYSLKKNNFYGKAKRVSKAHGLPGRYHPRGNGVRFPGKKKSILTASQLKNSPALDREQLQEKIATELILKHREKIKLTGVHLLTFVLIISNRKINHIESHRNIG